jgi:citrate lyase subunit beta/citryl-CoA lyase
MTETSPAHSPAPTTFLFVPGDRPDRFDRAMSSGADAVVLDLEDGVAPAQRPEARRNVVSWLEAGHPAIVRISASDSPDHPLDVRALQGAATELMLSKAETPAQAQSLTATMGTGVAVIALIETARGVLHASEIAAADGVTRLALGNIDLATELGVEADDRYALLAARSALVLASSSAGLIGPVDGVTTSLRDAEVIEGDASHAASLGFRGKLCVHPNQVGAARAGFVPSTDHVQWATAVLAATSEGEARSVGGAMVDRPVEAKARDVLRRAGLLR